MYCKECGYQIDNDSKFCSKCGKRQDGVENIILSQQEDAKEHKIETKSEQDNMENIVLPQQEDTKEHKTETKSENIFADLKPKSESNGDGCVFVIIIAIFFLSIFIVYSSIYQ